MPVEKIVPGSQGRSRREGRVSHEVPGSPESIIKARVLRFFDGADSSIVDGTPQVVGPYTVTIREGPASWISDSQGGRKRTIWRASSNRIPLARRTVNESASPDLAYDVYTLYGSDFDNRPIQLSVTEHPEESPRIRVNLPRHAFYESVDLELLSISEKADVETAFGINLPEPSTGENKTLK